MQGNFIHSQLKLLQSVRKEFSGMDITIRLKYLRFSLLANGFIFAFAIYPLMIIWSSGWAWHTGQSKTYKTVIITCFKSG
jgi:hypothetical protein